MAGKRASVPRQKKMKMSTTLRGGRKEIRTATKRRAIPPPGRSTGRPGDSRRAPVEIVLQGKRERMAPAMLRTCLRSIATRNEAGYRRAADARVEPRHIRTARAVRAQDLPQALKSKSRHQRWGNLLSNP